MSIACLYRAKYRGNLAATCSSAMDPGGLARDKAPRIPHAHADTAVRGTLALPPGASVERAFLVWAGDSQGCAPRIGSICLRTPASAANRLPGAHHVAASGFETVRTAGCSCFSSWADVTRQVTQGGPGDYAAYGCESSPQECDAGGWALYVYYRDDAQPFMDLSFHSGIAAVGGAFGSTLAFTLDGLQTPLAGPVGGTIAAVELTAAAGGAQCFYVENTLMAGTRSPSNGFDNADALMNARPPQSAPSRTRITAHVMPLCGCEVQNGASRVTSRLYAPGPPADTGAASPSFVAGVALAFQAYEVALAAAMDVSCDDGTPVAGAGATVCVRLSNVSSYATAVNAVYFGVLPPQLAFIPGSMRVEEGTFGGYTGPLTDAVDGDAGYVAPGGNTLHIHVGRGASGAAGGALQPGDSLVVSYRAVIADALDAGAILRCEGVLFVTARETGEEFSVRSAAQLIICGDKPTTAPPGHALQKEAAPAGQPALI